MRTHLFALAFLLGASAPALADEGPRGPYFVVEGPGGVDALPLKASRAHFSVAGVIARVRLNQVYENHGDRPLEAVYVFPASTRAAVHGMRLRIGERTIEAKIDARDRAKKAYEEAKSAGKQAGLLEQMRSNVLQMRVANIRPGDRIEVDVDYSELMVPTDGTYELVIPSVVGPRFTEEAERVESWTQNPHLSSGTPAPYVWHVDGDIHGGLPVAAVRSPSHVLSPRFMSDTRVSVAVDDERGGDRDFVLRYRLGADQVQSGLLLYPGAEEQFFLLQVAPPKRVAPTHIVPREYVFVVDVSGSMAGFPLLTTKRLLRRLVQGLRPQDRFNVVLFAGGSRVMSPQSVEPSAHNLEIAEQVIDGMQGGGGTHLLAALRRAFALPRDEARSTSFVLVTDGYVNVAPEAMRLVRERLGEANLFTFGIGSSVNRDLVERLARAGRGEPFVVLDPAEAADRARAFVRYIEQPVLTNVRVDFEGFDAYDVEPKAPGDLFASRPVTVFGKYRGQAAGRITVSGRSGLGSFFETVQIAEAESSDDLGALAHLWARHRVAHLEDMEALGGGSSAEEIAAIGLRYSLLTAHTSFVAVDSQPVLHGDSATEVRQVLPMPQGVSNQALGGVLGALGTKGMGSGGGGFARGALNGAMGGMRKPQAHVPMIRGGSLVLGSLDKGQIRRVIRRHRGAFKRAYERSLRSNVRLSGKLVFKITIGANGRVQQAEIEVDTVGDEIFAKAVLRILRRMRFPKPAGGGSVVIKYPLIFKPS